jgi:hypothetical protein
MQPAYGSGSLGSPSAYTGEQSTRARQDGSSSSPHACGDGHASIGQTSQPSGTSDALAKRRISAVRGLIARRPSSGGGEELKQPDQINALEAKKTKRERRVR